MIIFCFAPQRLVRYDNTYCLDLGQHKPSAYNFVRRVLTELSRFETQKITSMPYFRC